VSSSPTIGEIAPKRINTTGEKLTRIATYLGGEISP